MSVVVTLTYGERIRAGQEQSHQYDQVQFRLLGHRELDRSRALLPFGCPRGLRRSPRAPSSVMGLVDVAMCVRAVACTSLPQLQRRREHYRPWRTDLVGRLP
jgi:hypothetical protein